MLCAEGDEAAYVGEAALVRLLTEERVLPCQCLEVLLLEEAAEQILRGLVRGGLGIDEPYRQFSGLRPGHLSKATPETWTFTTGAPMPVMDSTAPVTVSCTCLATLTTLEP